MTSLSEPLDESETQRLTELIAETRSRSLAFCRGVFAAIGTAPTSPDVMGVFPKLVGSASEDRATIEETFQLLMREYNACSQCLQMGVPAVPAAHDHDAAAEFSRGYMVVAYNDEDWKKDAEAFEATARLAALGGLVDLDKLAPWDERAASKPEELLEEVREELPELVARLFRHFASQREAGARKSTAHVQPPRGAPKPSRNDPCPCGSGKKYKKCCLLEQ